MFPAQYLQFYAQHVQFYHRKGKDASRGNSTSQSAAYNFFMNAPANLNNSESSSDDSGDDAANAAND